LEPGPIVGRFLEAGWGQKPAWTEDDWAGGRDRPAMETLSRLVSCGLACSLVACCLR
jgi:hypothetical protein